MQIAQVHLRLPTTQPNVGLAKIEGASICGLIGLKHVALRDLTSQEVDLSPHRPVRILITVFGLEPFINPLVICRCLAGCRLFSLSHCWIPPKGPMARFRAGTLCL